MNCDTLALGFSIQVDSYLRNSFDTEIEFFKLFVFATLDDDWSLSANKFFDEFLSGTNSVNVFFP